MSTLWPILIALAVLLVTKWIISLLESQYKSGPNEAPLLMGWPFLGSAIAYGRRGRHFVMEQQRKHGDIFTLYMAGRRMTYLLDPFTIPNVYKQSKTLDFHPFVEDLAVRAFQLPVDVQHLYKDTIGRVFTSTLSGSHLADISASFQKQLVRIVDEFALKSHSGWNHGQLLDTVGRIFFDASVISVFGQGVDPSLFYDDFKEFDVKFPLLVLGSPFFVKKARAAQDRSASLLQTFIDDPANSNMSELIRQREVLFKSVGMTRFHGSQAEYSLLWASQSNTLLAAFWLLTYVISNKQCYDALQSELISQRDDSGNVNVDKGSFPILEASMTESLRLAGSILSVRVALEDQSLHVTSSGHTYHVRKGDYICIVASAPHWDPEIYSDPEKFDYTRFLSPKEFTKGGIPVRHHFLPFGGGSSMCPGRHFIAGFAGKLVEYPFDTIKVHMQTQANNIKTMDTIRTLLAEQGIAGLFRGLSAPLVGSMVENSVLFIGYNKMQTLIRTFKGLPSNAPLSVSEMSLAGAGAGMMVSFVLTPVELLKCQMQILEAGQKEILIKTRLPSSPFVSSFAGHAHFGGFRTLRPTLDLRRYYDAARTTTLNVKIKSSPLGLLCSILKNHGIGGLYRGHVATMMRETAGGAAWFGTYEAIVAGMLSSTPNRTKKDLPAWSLMFAGAMAGISYNTALFPADVIKSRLQTTHLGHSFYSVGKQLYQSEGWKGLYRGYGITLARSAPTSGVIFLTFVFWFYLRNGSIVPLSLNDIFDISYLNTHF